MTPFMSLFYGIIEAATSSLSKYENYQVLLSASGFSHQIPPRWFLVAWHFFARTMDIIRRRGFFSALNFRAKKGTFKLGQPGSPHLGKNP